MLFCYYIIIAKGRDDSKYATPTFVKEIQMLLFNNTGVNLTPATTLQITAIHGDQNSGEFTVEDSTGVSFTYGTAENLANLRKIEFGSKCFVGVSDAAAGTEDEVVDGEKFWLADDVIVKGIYQDKYSVNVECEADCSHLNVTIPTSLYTGTAKFSTYFNYIGKKLHIVFTF